MSSLLLGSYQNFTINKSLIKKIFSWKEPKLKSNTSYFQKSEQYNYDKKQGRLLDAIQ